MFCAQPEPNDCQGKAFYRTMDDSTNLAKNINRMIMMMQLVIVYRKIHYD